MSPDQLESIARRYLGIRNAQTGGDHGYWTEHVGVAECMAAWFQAFGLTTPVPSALVPDALLNKLLEARYERGCDCPDGCSGCNYGRPWSTRPMVLGDLYPEMGYWMANYAHGFIGGSA